MRKPTFIMTDPTLLGDPTDGCSLSRAEGVCELRKPGVILTN